MEEIRNLPEAAGLTQPVGASSRKQAGKNREAFKEILERKQGSAKEERQSGESDPGKAQDPEPAQKGEQSPEEPAERGALLDERA